MTVPEGLSGGLKISFLAAGRKWSSCWILDSPIFTEWRSPGEQGLHDGVHLGLLLELLVGELRD